jgi:ubiquitin C-terminal hydrolase
LPSQPRGLNHGNTHYFNSNPHILTCVSTTHDLYLQ